MYDCPIRNIGKVQQGKTVAGIEVLVPMYIYIYVLSCCDVLVHLQRSKSCVRS